MRWLASTLALLAACAALIGWLYERNRGGSDWLPPARAVAHNDALAVAAAIGGTCPRDCTVKLLAHPRTNHWTERIQIPDTIECVDINVRTFATYAVNGLAGVTRVGCESVSSGSAG
ncbi:MAG TPA: hypothetical protein VHW96_04475 [Solirubrobacteraceae bacterium]|jgi:hypothetical protein|nr:hypothetical protein [Solirubrobacteraceae bacterium]